ncbi:MBL fold metallo-hydrolase [Alteromonadaceae bacterium M269]|nr:MBL fold metallo-hydrolase [Alteromonadaceae bacterium M269]
MIRNIFQLIILSFGLLSTSAYAYEQCKNADVSLQVLGSGGPELNDGRASSSYLVWHKDNSVLLVDAGPGSSVAFGEVGANFADLEAILLTHLHVDHSADIPAYVKGSFFSSRIRPMSVYGPDKNQLMPATSDFIRRLIGPQGAFPYLSNHLVGERGRGFKIGGVDIPLLRDKVHSFKLTDDINIEAVFTHHGPVASVAWRANVAGCSIVFSGDMSNQYEVLSSLAKDADLLVMNHAVPEEARGVARNLHMPPSVIGEIAKEANAKTVLLSHYMRRTLGRSEDSLVEVKKHYKGEIKLAEDKLKVRVSN